MTGRPPNPVRPCPVCGKPVSISRATERVHRHGPPGKRCAGTGQRVSLYGPRPSALGCCPRCQRMIALTPGRLVRRHGPPGFECAGSGQWVDVDGLTEATRYGAKP